MGAENRAKYSTTHMAPRNNPSLLRPPPSSLSGALNGCLGCLDGPCIEKLLLHCAAALEANDITVAQQVMWVLNNVASANGDPNQRLTVWFLRALIARASHLCPTALPFALDGSSQSSRRPMTVTELAGYIDLTPWHRFGFSIANRAILQAVQGHRKVHIVDFSVTHCMQWPTLIDELAKRPQGPPVSLRITVPSAHPPVPPSLNIATEEVGLRLMNFAKLRNIPLEFKVLKTNSPGNSLSFHQQLVTTPLDPSSLGLQDDEALIVNCHNWLRYLSGDSQGNDDNTRDSSSKDGFLEFIHGLNPTVVTMTDEDADLDTPSLSSRIMGCFNYLWILFDALETSFPKECPQRTGYEADVGQKIENIIRFEGSQRIERSESGARFAQRMRRAGFGGVLFDEETARGVRVLLSEHASGWGMKREEDMLVLTWKGHSSVFTSAWVPKVIS